MPVICPNCHKMVAEQPKCANCGKPLKVTSMPRPGYRGPQSQDDSIDRETMSALMRYSLSWVLGVVAIGLVCVGLIYVLLLR